MISILLIDNMSVASIAVSSPHESAAHQHNVPSSADKLTRTLLTPDTGTEESISNKKPARKKKVTWQMKDQLQLRLRLYNRKPCLKSTHGSAPTSFPPFSKNTVISPLRLKKVISSTSLTATNSPNTVYLSSGKYQYQLVAMMGLSNTHSPIIVPATQNKPNKLEDSPPKLKILSTKTSYSGINNTNKNTRNNCYKNDYSNNYIHTGKLPYKYIRNSMEQVEGYPKLQRLYKLKEQQVGRYATRPYGCRVKTENILKTLNSWAYNDDLKFDVIMIGALTENQLIYPLLSKLPIDKLCCKPGFLFIWASTQKISELSTLMNDTTTWAKKFRRSEELVFIPIDKNSAYYPKDSNIPENQLLEEVQWHCWMCITGTVRRSTDKELIHCNINTDLSIENPSTGNSAVPPQIYKVVENFSSSTRRLHIIPNPTGLKKSVNVRPGWVIVSPDVILDNFESERYKRDIEEIGSKIPFHEEIEQLRPKTPA